MEGFEEDRVLDLSPIVRGEEFGSEAACRFDGDQPRIETREQAGQKLGIVAVGARDAHVERVALEAERVDEGCTGDEGEELAVVVLEALRGHRAPP